MTDRIAVQRPVPTTAFFLECDRVGQSVEGNYTVLRLYLRCVNEGNSTSYSNYYGYQRIAIDGIWGGAEHNGNPFLPGGYSNGQIRWREGPWDIRVPHNSDGTRGAVTLRMTFEYDNGDQIGNYVASFSDFPALGTVPAAPTSKVPTNITATAMTFDIDDGADGGPPITSREYQYSTSNTFPGASVLALNASGTVRRTDLTPNTTYYWRGRTRNARGVSAWSTIRSATTLPTVPSKPTSKALTAISHTGMTFDIDDASYNGGSAVTSREYQVSTSKDFTGVAVGSLNSSGTVTRSDLKPGTEYFWRGRTKNAIGASPWSDIQSATTLPGVYVKVDDVWVLAVPYVKVSGVWKLAIPYVKKAGIWKQTIS